MARILYTFRRCPYAIRARMALSYANVSVEECEVDLKNKPPELFLASPKGTVPVLILETGQVLEQSLDIMRWALSQSDLEMQRDALIDVNDSNFKLVLDNYKYPQRSEKNDPVYYREKARAHLERLNSLLNAHRYLLADHITFADVAIFPFIRQFYFVDKQWFEASEYKSLQAWLDTFLNSTLFVHVMTKAE